MGIRFFKILLFHAGIIILLHTLVPHQHHNIDEGEHEHSHHEEPQNLLEYLAHAFHFSAGYGHSDSYSTNNITPDFAFDTPTLLTWLKNEQIFVVYSISYAKNIPPTSFVDDGLLLRGPPSLI